MKSILMMTFAKATVDTKLLYFAKDHYWHQALVLETETVDVNGVSVIVGNSQLSESQKGFIETAFLLPPLPSHCMFSLRFMGRAVTAVLPMCVEYILVEEIK